MTASRLQILAAFLISAASGVWACADDSVTLTPDIVYGHKAGMALTFDVYRPAQANGAGVLYMMSGGWVSSWFPPEGLVREDHAQPNQFDAIVRAGYTLFVVRHGSSPYFKVPDAVTDVRLAVRFIRLHAADYGIDPARLGVCGSSAGGHLSLMLGTTGDDGIADAKDSLERVSDRVQAVVAYYPPTKIDEFFPLKERFPALDFDVSLASDVSPLLQVSQDDAPVLLIHGNRDELVPLSNSERIYAALQDRGVKTNLIVIDGAAHEFKGNDGLRAQQALVDWFNAHLSNGHGQ